MERLKSAYLLAIIALAAVPAVGQQASPHEPTHGIIAVVGDLEHCNTYSVPSGNALTVRQAVMNAGLLSESVSVTVIRSAQDHAQWTQLVSATSADNGEPVESGDVLVVQSMSPLTAAVRKNAALRTDSGVVVVRLEQDGIVIGDVLQATNNLSLADGQLKVICRFPGQTPITKAEVYHPIQHGDVISVSRSSPTVLMGFGRMSPAVSEWKHSSTTEPRDPFLPEHVTSHSSPVASSPVASSPVASSQATPAPFPSAAALEPAMTLPIPDAESLETDTARTDHVGETPATVVTALSISQSEDVEDAAASDNQVSSASESTTVAPMAPLEMETGTVTNAKATAFNPWNLVFIGGLLLAGTLILAGTLKPEPDDNPKFSNVAFTAATSSATRSHTTAARQPKPTEAARQLSVALPASRSADTQIPFETAIRTAHSEQPGNALIAAHEWFSSDWHGQVVSSELPSQGGASSAEQTLQSIRTDKIDVASQSSGNPGAAEPRPLVTGLATEKAEKALSADERSFSDLEDLLQNRLPIDLCETHLPLRVALFGRPAGPRRLRIDAAHTAIPAPHMHRSSEKRRDEPVAATAVAAPTPPTHTETGADSAGSLDRALQFLQERTES